MKLMSSTVISAAALMVALSFTPVQAEPQQGGMSDDGPPAAANNSGGDQPGGAMGSPAGLPNQSGAAAAGNSDQMSPGEGKGKSAEGAAPSEGQSGKGAKDGNDIGMKTGQDYPAAGDKAKGKSAEGTMQSEDKGAKDAKPGDQPEGQGSNTAGEEDASGKSKAGATAEGKGDRQDRPGKSVRLESNDVSKVRTYFSRHRPTAHRIDRNQVSVSIGVGIPSAIVLYELPPDVIVVSGACPIKYLVWDDDIVLVDSCTREVVEIISGVA
jgi:hypothetical protein